jgi:hypothetical protein
VLQPEELPKNGRPRRTWKAAKASEMRLIMSRLVMSLRAAGFTVEQQLDACINLGRAFGVEVAFLQRYLVANVSPEAAAHPFFHRRWEPRYRVGDRVLAGEVPGVVRAVTDPSELGVLGLERPYQYLVETAAGRLSLPEERLAPRP